MIFVPLALLSLGAIAPPQGAPQAPDATRKCPPPVVTAMAPHPGRPMVRKLNEEPPAALIAAVDVRHDGCPVMLVLAPGESSLAPGWTPAPGESVRSIE